MKARTRRTIAYTSLFALILLIAAQIYIVIAGVSVDDGAKSMMRESTFVLFALVSTMKDFYFGDSEGKKED